MTTAAIIIFLASAVIIYGLTAVRGVLDREDAGLVLPIFAVLIGALVWALLFAAFI